jgi:cytochrome P450
VEVETQAPEIRRDGPGGCPVLHGFRPLEPEQVDDPGELLALARHEAPVFFAPEFDMYVVTRHEDARRALADHETFVGIGLSEHAVPEAARDVLPNGFLPQQPGWRAWADAEQHVRLRRLAQMAFTRKAALANVPRMRELFDATIDEFVGEGRADLLPAYARRVPMQLIIAILGLDPALEPKLHDWVADFMQLMGNPNLEEAQLVELAHRQAEFYRFGEDLIAERRRDPGGEGNLISDLIAARDESGAPALNDNEIFTIVLIAIIGGGETSVILIGQIVRRALENGGALWTRFLADPDLLDSAIEEELRHSFIGRIISRRTTREVELGGVTIPKGALVGLHLWSSGRDEDVFAEPERYDPDRPEAGKHLGFGHGTKFCMGAPLARVETRVAIERLLERLPNARLVPGHELRRRASIALPGLVDGLVVEWDTP